MHKSMDLVSILHAHPAGLLAAPLASFCLIAVPDITYFVVYLPLPSTPKKEAPWVPEFPPHFIHCHILNI